MKRNAHTLVELLVVVMIMAVLTAVAIPRLRFEAVSQKKAAAVAYKLVADLRKTQSMALRDAATNAEGFRLRMEGTSPYVEYLIRDASSEAEVYRTSIDSSVTVTTSPTYEFVFGPLGDMTLGGSSEIVVAAGEVTYRITFVGSTGAVTCTEL